MAGMIVAVVVVGGVCGLLVADRAGQGDTQAREGAAAEGATLHRLFTGLVEPQAITEATGLTASTAVRTSLGAADPSARTDQLAGLFSLGSVTVLPGSRVVIFDSAGTAVYTDECGPRIALSYCQAQPGPHLTATVPSVALALAEGVRAACASSANRQGPTPASPGCPSGYQGVELVGGSLPVFDASVPVWDTGNRFIGVVVVSTTVQAAFHRVGVAIPDTAVVITVGQPPLVARYDPARNGVMQPAAIPSALTARVTRGAPTIDEQYTGPSGGTVAGSFVGVSGADGRVSAYVGAEVATATTGTQTAADQRAIVLVGVSVLVLVFLVLMSIPTLAPHLVGGGAGSLLGGTVRPAGGLDATQPGAVVPATDGGGWARLVADVEIVQRSLVEAVAGIGGPGARVSLFAVVAGELHEAVCPEHGGLAALGRGEMLRVLAGDTVRREVNEEDPPLLLVPAYVDSAVRGAVAVWSVAELSDAQALAVSAVAGGGVTALERMRVS
jgi:hypothetical protein